MLQSCYCFGDDVQLYGLLHARGRRKERMSARQDQRESCSAEHGYAQSWRDASVACKVDALAIMLQGSNRLQRARVDGVQWR